MQLYLFVAGCLSVILGAVHSVLGELLIFRRLRNGGIIPTNGSPVLKERHVRILWASWHLVTVFGWALGAILCWISFSSAEPPGQEFIVNSILLSMFFGGVLVLIGTKGKHPGWVVLFAIAVLSWMG